MIVNIVLLIIGFVLLIKGADVFVESASKVASMFKIPQIVIGLTIVAFGTSAPEAAVSIASTYNGNAGIAVGNIIGSNIANILLILGVAGMITALPIKRNTMRVEIPFVVVITVLLALLGFDERITRLDGVILWLFFIGFLVYLFFMSKNGADSALDDVPEYDENDKLWKLIIILVLGMICIVVGSQVTVNSASAIAQDFGVSDRIIGLTIVSIGTSLPELVTSISASLKGKNEIAIGNVIGSNIFNILFVLGTAALVAPSAIPFPISFIVDIIIAIGAILLFLIFIGKDKHLKRYGAFIMLCCYIGYMIYIL